MSMITIVSGPSCAGKTAMIDGAKMWMGNVIGGSKWELDHTRTVRPIANDTRKLSTGRWYYHYNTMRLAKSENETYEITEKELAYRYDAAWKSFCKMHKGEPIIALVLLVPRSILIERMEARKWNDPESDDRKPYDSKKWIQALRRIDLCAMYYRWMYELDRRGWRVRCIDASGRDNDHWTAAEQPGFPGVSRNRADLFMT